MYFFLWFKDWVIWDNTMISSQLVAQQCWIGIVIARITTRVTRCGSMLHKVELMSTSRNMLPQLATRWYYPQQRFSTRNATMLRDKLQENEKDVIWVNLNILQVKTRACWRLQWHYSDNVPYYRKVMLNSSKWRIFLYLKVLNKKGQYLSAEVSKTQIFQSSFWKKSKK